MSDLQKVGDQELYTCDAIPVNTLARTLDAVPLMVPPIADHLSIDALLPRIDGLMVRGGMTNVHPSFYGREASDDEGPFDQARDATVLPLIRAALDYGTPLLFTCRGFQELNVAFGGTLKQEPEDQPEEKKHGTPESAHTDDERYRIRHAITTTPNGLLARVIGKRADVNSLHSVLIDEPAPDLRIEALGEDKTIEAFSVPGAKGFALAVAFHPEYWEERDATSAAILQAFGDAVRSFAARRQRLEAAE
jgi:putative glutamine amidotransferase